MVIHFGNKYFVNKIKIFVDEDKSEAQGNVRVKVIQDGEAGLKK